MPLIPPEMPADRARTPCRGMKSRLAWTLLVSAVLGASAVAGVSCREDRDEHVAVDGEAACVTCHRSEFLRAEQPPHADALPVTCEQCHSETSWSPTTFDHAERFKLTGAHADAACTGCHTAGFERAQTPSECVGCHRDDYDKSPLPGHDQFPTACADCHGTSAWKPASGASATDHDQFPLQNAHAKVECASCHTQGYAPGQTPNQCVGCHQDDYDRSPLPGHDQFPTSCADCHGTNGWKPATGGAIASHDQFPLQGVHAMVQCASCHTQGYAPGQTPNQCVGCHQDDYDRSPLPGHDQFPTSCADCHGTSGWKPATGGAIDHDKFFPLQGAHTAVQCASCHTQGFAAGQTPNTCVGCHRDDYDRSPLPGHDQFATTCADCHSTSAWKPASGAHPETAFPIARGKHSGYACNDCHNPTLGPNGRGNADCVGCHEGEHTRAKMDAEHQGESGYPQGAAPPNFCLDCHRDGGGGD